MKTQLLAIVIALSGCATIPADLVHAKSTKEPTPYAPQKSVAEECKTWGIERGSERFQECVELVESGYRAEAAHVRLEAARAWDIATGAGDGAVEQDPVKDCGMWGITPGTELYLRCIEAAKEGYRAANARAAAAAQVIRAARAAPLPARPTYEEAYNAAYERLKPEVVAGRLKPSQALLMTYSEAVEVAGHTPGDPGYLAFNELKLYEVTLHEKFEAGSLTEAELRYLFAQKKSEIIGRLRDQKIARERLRIEDLRSLETQDVRCHSYAVGRFVNTDCF